MLGAAVTILLLWLLHSQVNGVLITADAKCHGYDIQWMFSSIGQSPCDVAAELASVCTGGVFRVNPLEPGDVYGGPRGELENKNCWCSSVFYSLLSGCAFCQGNPILGWSLYKTNCTTTYLTVFNQDIPEGVKVPAYAYQDVSVSDRFDPVLARSVKGVESSFSAGPTQTNSGNPTAKNTPAIIGGVVGGVVALGLIAALVVFLVLRSKRKTQKYNSSFQVNPSVIHTMSPHPSTPGWVYNPNDRTVDPNLNRPLSEILGSNITGSSTTPQTPMPKNLHYSGMPEL